MSARGIAWIAGLALCLVAWGVIGLAIARAQPRPPRDLTEVAGEVYRMSPAELKRLWPGLCDDARDFTDDCKCRAQEATARLHKRGWWAFPVSVSSYSRGGAGEHRAAEAVASNGDRWIVDGYSNEVAHVDADGLRAGRYVFDGGEGARAGR
jgi:hypothetical protein